MERKQKQKERFIAVRRDRLGRIREFRSDYGNIYNYELAKEAIDKDLIDNALYKKVDGLHIIYHKNEKDPNFTQFPNF